MSICFKATEFNCGKSIYGIVYINWSMVRIREEATLIPLASGQFSTTLPPIFDPYVFPTSYLLLSIDVPVM